MSGSFNGLYEFGEFRLDASERVLWRGDAPVPLSPKVFDTLALLVKRHGQIVSKSEMMELIWSDSFVEESNLTQNIYTLRRVLGTDETGGHFIENVPRRGYRFAAPVRTQLGNVYPDAVTDNGKQLSEVEDIERDLHSSSKLSRSRAFKFASIGILVLILLGLFTLAGFRVFPIFSETGSTSALTENVDFQKLTFTGDLAFPVLAPDGKSFAFVRGDALFVQDVNSGNEIRLNVGGTKLFGILQFSPDSSFIYFRDRVSFDLAANVFRVSRFGGEPQRVAEDVRSGFGFSPDGTQMVFVRGLATEARNSLVIKDLETGSERLLATIDSPSEYLDNGHPTWSHDGKKIVVVVFLKLRQTSASGLWVVDVDSGKVEEIKTRQLWQFEQAAWLPGDQELIVAARENGKFFQLWRISYPDGQTRRITNDLSIYRGVSLSTDGTKALARQFTLYSHLWTGERTDLSNLRQRTFGNLNRDGVNGLAYMPNGDILYVSRIMGDRDLWLYRPSDDSRQQLTKQVAELHENPTVSPDGRYIYFNSNRSGANHIWRMDANGSDATQVTFGEKQTELHPQISLDGTWLYYIQKSPSASTIVRKSLVHDRTEALTKPGELAPDNFLALSPDGKFLAFHNAFQRVDEEEGRQLYPIAVIPSDGPGEPRFYNVRASRLVVRWTRDGSGFEFIENSPEGARIWRQGLGDDKPAKAVVEVPKAFLHNFVWSADGERLVLSRGVQANDAILLTNILP